LKYDKESQEASEKEEENKLSKAELIKLRDEWKGKLTDKFTKFDLYYVLLSLYTYLPPLRSQEFYNTFLNIKKRQDLLDQKINHLCLETKTLHMYNYKTAKTYGPRKIDIPDELIKILYDFKQTVSIVYFLKQQKTKSSPDCRGSLFEVVQEFPC